MENFLSDAAAQSNYKETVMLVSLVITCVSLLLTQMLKFMKARPTSGEKATVDREIEEARVASIRIITTKDGDGNYILLSFPRMMRELIVEMRGIGEQMTHLVNHQSEMMKKLNHRIDKFDRK